MTRTTKHLLSAVFCSLLALGQVPAAALAQPDSALSPQSGDNDSASINGTSYSSTQAALNAAQPGDVIVIDEDPSDRRTFFASTLVVSQDCTLDMNGMSLGQVRHGDAMFIVNEGVTFTLTNSQPDYQTWNDMGAGNSVFFNGSLADARQQVSDTATKQLVKSKSGWGTVCLEGGFYCNPLLHTDTVTGTLTVPSPLIIPTGGEYAGDGYTALTSSAVAVPPTHEIKPLGSTYAVVPKTGTPIATVNSVSCSSVADIINALSSQGSGTVTLLTSFALDRPLTISSGSWTLNLGGHTITCLGGNGASLSTSALSTAALTQGGIEVQGSAKVELVNGMISSTTNKAVLSVGGGELTLGASPAGVEVVTSAYEPAALVEGGTLNVAGGSLTANNDAVQANAGKVNLTGGKLTTQGVHAALNATNASGATEVLISGAAELSGATALQTERVSSAAGSVHASVTGGSINGALVTSNADDLEVSGGTFDSAARLNLSNYLVSNAVVDASGNVTTPTLTNDMVSLIVPDGGLVYNTATQEPQVVVLAGSNTLVKDTDYTLAYRNNTNVGTATVAVTGKGSWSGTVEKEFSIAAAPIESGTVVIDQDPFTIGSDGRINPSLSVTVKGHVLTRDLDYRVTFAASTTDTTATATITGRGNYTGTLTKSFELIGTPSEPETQDEPGDVDGMCRVTFIDGLTKLAFLEKDVAKGGAVAAPTPPEHAGWEFYGWSASLENVTENMEVTAIYQRIVDPGTQIPRVEGDTATATRYTNNNGTKRVVLTDASGSPVSGWQLAGGKWYFAGGDGVAHVGYLQDGVTTYYLDADGTMHTGWLDDGGRRLYCFRHSGAVAFESWFHEGGVWYWADKTGARVTGWSWMDGVWYYFDPASAEPGAMKTGWLWDGAWYFFNESGAMLHDQFLLSDGKWYWMLDSGTMLTNSWHADSGRWYYFGDDGAMYANRMTPDGFWVGADGAW